MQISLLGSAELVTDCGHVIAVPSRRQRQLLVALGVHNGRHVSVDTLSEWLWPGALPRDPVATVQTNVSRLRRLFDESLTLRTESNGYRLDVMDDCVDVKRFERMVVAARATSSEASARTLEEALRLWRGTPFTEIDHPEIDAARVRIEALHHEAVESLLDSLAQLGRHDEVVSIAEAHVLSYPTHERPVALLMRSLFATGRQTDALNRYRRVRSELVEQLGVEPSPELQDLELAILRQDVDVAPQPRAREQARPQSRNPSGVRASQHIRFCRATDGVRLAYATSGAGAPLVRTANWMTHLVYDWDSPVWRHWLDELSARRRLVRYDERGCGLSDWNAGAFTFDDWVYDLEAIVDELELDTFPLLGVSQGGAVAVAYATRHPQRVSRLVLVGAYAQGRLARATSDAQRAEAAVHVDLARVGWGTDDPAFRQVFTSHFLPDAPRPLWDSFNELQRRTTTPENAARFMEVFGDIDVVAQAPRVSCPTLVVHSRDELRIPADSARQLASLIPDSRLVMLPSRNHLLIEDEPSWPLLLAELDDFLAS